jgi:hypothetical protein
VDGGAVPCTPPATPGKCLPGYGTVRDVAATLTPLGYRCGPETDTYLGNLRCQGADAGIAQGELDIDFQSPTNNATDSRIGGFSVTVIGEDGATLGVLGDACQSLGRTWRQVVPAIFAKYPRTEANLLGWWSRHLSDCVSANTTVIPEGRVDGYDMALLAARHIENEPHSYNAGIYVHAVG